MSRSLKDAESLYTDQHDVNVISPVVNSSDQSGQKNEKAGDKSYEPAKRALKNLETSSTRKQDKRHKTRKRKIYSPSSSPGVVKRSNKKRPKKSRSRQEKRKRLPSYPHPQPARLLNQKMK